MWLTFILREGKRGRYFNSTTEITPANALETNHWSGSCQYALPFFNERWQESPSLSVITSRSMPYFVFLSFHPSSHTLVHMVKGLHARWTVPFLALEGSLKNFLSVLHSLVVKCMAAYHFPIPSENRCCCVECQMLMFVPLRHSISFNYVQI